MIPDHISLGLGDRQLTVDVGELLFPALVLVVSGLYYVDTRGLPDQSLMYAEPVLYATVLLAIITIAQHAIAIEDRDAQITDGVGGRVTDVDDRDEPVGSGVAGGTVDAGGRDEQVDPATRSDSPHFNRRSAAILAVITTGYVTVLTQLSAFITDAVFIGLTAAFLGALLALFGERKLSRLVAYSVGFTVLVWAVFIYWLRVPLA